MTRRLQWAACIAAAAAAVLVVALWWWRLGPAESVLWLPHENAGIDVPVSCEPGGPARFVAVGRSDSAAWTVASLSSSIRGRLRAVGLDELACGTEFQETGIVLRLDRVAWAQIVRGAGPGTPTAPTPDALDLVGRWDHTTGRGETTTLELGADGHAAGLAPTLTWTRWRDRIAAGFPAWSGMTPAAGPDPVPRGGRDDAFDAVLSADLRSYEGTDARGRAVRGRRLDDALRSPGTGVASAADLRFVGTVTGIGLRRPPDPGRRFDWVVNARVERVLAGAYDGETFSFVVHSPHQEGLREGGRYVIDANRTSGREFEFVAARAVE